MGEIFSRTEALIGSNALSKIQNAHVAVFGLGGVGSAAFEALVRSGVGTISVFDLTPWQKPILIGSCLL